MEIFYTSKELKNHLEIFKSQDLNIGFIPTMGALHNGHIELLNQSKLEGNYSVVSIFVNPTQFNDATDLLKYPRTPEADISILQQNGCDVLYMPTREDVYPDKSFESIDLDLGRLSFCFEAASRPGHYQGVVAVVKRLFDIVEPQTVYFGQKDFQQCLVIKKIIQEFELPISFKMIPTIREKDGLAMSSRNVRLSLSERREAPFIYKSLKKAHLALRADPTRIWKAKSGLVNDFKYNSNFKLDYSDICNTIDLLPLDDLSFQDSCVIIIAVQLGRVRLIDNLLIFRDEWM